MPSVVLFKSSSWKYFDIWLNLSWNFSSTYINSRQIIIYKLSAFFCHFSGHVHVVLKVLLNGVNRPVLRSVLFVRLGIVSLEVIAPDAVLVSLLNQLLRVNSGGSVPLADDATLLQLLLYLSKNRHLIFKLLRFLVLVRCISRLNPPLDSQSKVRHQLEPLLLVEWCFGKQRLIARFLVQNQ